MAITPVKLTVKQAVSVEGHEVSDGIHVGQKLSDTEIERSNCRNASYFLHFAVRTTADGVAAVQRFDLDVTEHVQKGKIVVA
jgi:hypothetical protein